MNISLSKFCKERGLAKSTVYDRCKELGIDTSEGLDSEAVLLLEEEFQVSTELQVETSEPEIVIDTDLSQPGGLELSVPHRFDLSTFMGNQSNGAIANPLELAEGVATVVAGLSQAMDSAEAFQVQRLQKIREVKNSATTNLQILKQRAESFRVKSEMIALMEANENAELANVAAEVQSMGKPQPTGDSGQSS